MRNIANKVDNVDVLSAAEFNASIMQELENAVTNTGITLDPAGGPDTNDEMLAQAITRTAQGAVSYQDGGAADAYVLTAVGGFVQPTAYTDGMIVTFQVGNTNTGASTINVAGIGVVDLVDDTGSALGAGVLVQNRYVTAVYDSASGDFRVVFYGGQSTTPLFTQEYNSAAQTITTGGLITLAHGLGVKPKLIQYVLKCTTAEHGYSIGDEIFVDFNSSDAGLSRPNNPEVNATNIIIRYNATATVFGAQNATTGANAALTNGSWELYVNAYV